MLYIYIYNYLIYNYIYIIIYNYIMIDNEKSEIYQLASRRYGKAIGNYFCENIVFAFC